MSKPLDVDIIEEAEKRAEAEIIELIRTLYELNTGSQGETFGTRTMSREDRILAFLDDARSGALDSLGIINKKFQEQYIAAYRRDVAAGPVMRPASQEQLTVGAGADATARGGLGDGYHGYVDAGGY